MHLDAHSALAAMERSWRSQHLARVAVTQFVLFLFRLYVSCPVIDVLVKDLGQILELSEVEKLIHAVSYAHLLELGLKFVFIHVIGIILPHIASLFLLLIWNA